jgi:hypothetical protein
MSDDFTFYNNNDLEEKKYLQFKVISLRNVLNKEEYDTFWTALIDHHCFRGNDTMMVLERFYYSKENYPSDRLLTKNDFNIDYDEFHKFCEDIYSSSLVGYHVMRAVLKENHQLCQNESRLSLLKEYDGILLNITW